MYFITWQFEKSTFWLIFHHKSKTTSLTKNLKYDMEHNLLRPYFKSFIKMIDQYFKRDIEIFIYTASEKKWAYTIIPIIESIVNKKVNRPIFTRDDCKIQNNKYIKSINFVRKKVLQVIKKKYNVKDNTKMKNLEIYLIDNNITLPKEEHDSLILCPSYEYSILCNPMRNIPETIINKYYKLIGNEILHKIYSNVWELYKDWYDNAYAQHIENIQINEHYKHDIYWKKVCVTMMNCRKSKSPNDCMINNLKRIHKKPE